MSISEFNCELLCTVRTELDLTTQDMGKMFGLSASAWYKYEYGKRPIPVSISDACKLLFFEIGEVGRGPRKDILGLGRILQEYGFFRWFIVSRDPALKDVFFSS